MALSKKKLATKTRSERVGVSLYFEGTKFIAKLVKRVTGRRYADAAMLVESAFQEVFGTLQHVAGTTTWAKSAADPDKADEVFRRLSLSDEVLSLTFNRPKRVIIPTPKKAARTSKGDRHAVEVLKREVFGDGLALGVDGSIKDAEKSINNLEERLRKERLALDGLKTKREKLLETIARLDG